MNQASPQKLSVCGSFGFGNAGDEAIPLAVADMARHLGRSLDIHAISRFAKPALPEVIGIGEQDTARLEALRGDPLIVSGGGIIEDAHYATIFQCAHLLKRSFSPRACLLGVSVEPGVSYSRRNTWRLWWQLRRFGKVYTRDVLSEATLNNLLPGVKTETIGDLVLWLEADARALPAEVKLPQKFVAAVLAPRWSQDRHWLSWISSELQALCKELDAALVFVPMTGPYDDDRNEHRAVIAEFRKSGSDIEVVAIEPWLSARAIAHVLGQAEIVVSMRLHGCVIAYAQHTPCIGLVYHPKLMGFFRTIGCEHTVLPESIPQMQHGESYGYRFSDLELKTGQLVQKAVACRSHTDYSRLPELKNRSASALKDFLDSTVAVG